jgi:hypothetical protein
MSVLGVGGGVTGALTGQSTTSAPPVANRTTSMR